MRKTLLSVALAAFAFSAVAQETVYFESNFTKIFEPFKDWVGSKDNATKSLDAVGDDDPSAYLPEMITPKATVGDNKITPASVMVDLGYEFQKNSAGEIKGFINWQKFYLRFGTKNTQGSLTLPKIEEFGEGKTGIKISYDWCPWRNTNTAKTDPGKYDDAKIVIIVKNGDEEHKFPQEGLNLEDKLPLKWYPVEVDLQGVTLNKDSRIIIRNIDEQFGASGQEANSPHRFFLNNIKVFSTGSTAVAEIENETNAPVEYFNLQGVKVSNPENGLFIRVKGNKAEKVVLN